MTRLSLNTKQYGLIALVLLLVLLSGIFYAQLSSFVYEHYGLIGWAIGIVVPIVCALYYQNRSFYLWIQRNIFLPFRRTHAEWSFVNQFVTSQENDFENAKEVLIKRYVGKYRFLLNTGNKVELLIGEKTTYSLEIEPAENSNLLLTFKSGFVVVPSYEYETTLDTYASLVGEVERNLRGRQESNFSITIKFLDKNPYFGFLLQSLPKDYIKDFRLNVSLPIGDEKAYINADKDKLIVNAGDAMSLRSAVIDYLSFSPSISH